MDPKEDKWYITRVLDGDANAFSHLIDRYKDMVYTLAYKMMRNHEEAEELAQDAFVKAYQSLKSFRGSSKFSTWLYKITYNSAISRLRKNRPDQYSIDESDYLANEYAETRNGFEELVLAERKRMLNRSLKELDGEEEFLITLYYYEEKKLEEIADITGLTKNNVKVKLFRARKRLLSLLERYMEKEHLRIA